MDPCSQEQPDVHVVYNDNNTLIDVAIVLPTANSYVQHYDVPLTTAEGATQKKSRNTKRWQQHSEHNSSIRH